MEIIELKYPSKRTVPRQAHVGVVGSGDLEVLLQPIYGDQSEIRIRTSVDGYRSTWIAIFERFFARYDGVVRLEINDAGATPGVVLLRLEQAVEISEQ